MDNEQIAEQKAHADFLAAESIAKKRKLIDVNKWSFICGYLQERLALAYGEIQ